MKKNKQQLPILDHEKQTTPQQGEISLKDARIKAAQFAKEELTRQKQIKK